MSLVDSVLEVLKTREQQAKDSYWEALRTGVPAVKIAEAAQAAGIEPAQIRKDLEVLEQARDASKAVEGLEGIREDLAKKRNVAEGLQQKAEKAAEVADEAWFAVRAVESNLRQVEQSRSELLTMYRAHPNLLLPNGAPAAVVEAWALAKADEAAKARLDAARQAVADAKTRLQEDREELHALEYGNKWLPEGTNRRQLIEDLQARIKADEVAVTDARQAFDSLVASGK